MPKLSFALTRVERQFPKFVPRRSLVALIEIAHATPGQRTPLEREDRQALEQELAHVYAEARKPGSGKPDDRVDRHLKNVLKNWPTRPKGGRIAPRVDVVLQEGVSNLKNSIKPIDCQECARACNSVPCHAHHEDESTNMDDSRGGLCWKKVPAIIEFALTHGQSAYNFSPEVLPSCLPIEVSVCVRDTDPNSEVNGRVSLTADSRDRRRADVTLTIPQDLAPHDYHGLLYAAFHEIFIHVPQGVLHETERGSVGEHCGFTEGFVDAAAAARVQELLERGVSPKGWRPDICWASISQTAANHSLRTTPPVDPKGPAEERMAMTKEYRLYGRLVFEKLRRHFLHEDLIIRLACSLNAALPTTGTIRMRVLHIVDEVLHEPEGALLALVPLVKQVARGERPVGDLLEKLPVTV